MERITNRALCRDLIKVTRDEGTTLSSGRQSDIYFDCRELITSEYVNLLAAEILMVTSRKHFNVIAGPELSGALLAQAIAVVAERRCVAIRKTPKEYGVGGGAVVGRLRASDDVLLVDDVVTTGTSLYMAKQALNLAGAHVTCIATIVDRQPAKGENIATTFAGIPFLSLFRYNDLARHPSEVLL